MQASTPKTLLLLLPLLVLAGCQSSAEEAGSAYPPPPVQVMAVEPANVPLTREYVGRTRGSRDVAIHARVTGIIEARLYEEGTRVSAGDPLFRIDPEPFEARVAAAEAELAHARARLARARREHDRLAPLAEADAVSRREIDDARSEVELTAAAVQLADAALHNARIELGYTTVKAPIDGITGIAHKFEGALVTAGGDSLLTTLVQTDPIDVHFSISENEWLKQQREIAAGLLEIPELDAFDVRIELADGTMPDRIGHINFADVQIDEATGTYHLRARFPNEDGALKAGQFVRVHVSGAERPNAVTVPQKAVLEGPQGKFVFVVGEAEDGTSVAEIRPVTVGEWLGTENGEHWIVQSGLDAGDRVILDNFVKLQPGAPVAITDTRAGTKEAPALAAVDATAVNAQ